MVDERFDYAVEMFADWREGSEVSVREHGFSTLRARDDGVEDLRRELGDYTHSND